MNQDSLSLEEKVERAKVLLAEKQAKDAREKSEVSLCQSFWELSYKSLHFSRLQLSVSFTRKCERKKWRGGRWDRRLPSESSSRMRRVSEQQPWRGRKTSRKIGKLERKSSSFVFILFSFALYVTYFHSAVLTIFL